MPSPRLDWSTATVKDGKLAVELDGDAPKGWRRSLEATAARLGSSGWGKVTVKRDTVRVSRVDPGSEEKLRHHLESLVQEANTACGLDEDDYVEREEQAGEDDGPDARMTHRFREFADAG